MGVISPEIRISVELPRLNFPEYNFTFQPPGAGGGGLKIFDKIRLKYVTLTPEEWVRQHLLRYLTEGLGYPKGLLGVEKEIRLHKLSKRFDALVYDRSLKPVVLVECKAPGIVLGQDVFDQAARYNLVLNVPYFLLSNGTDTFFCRIDHERGGYYFLGKVPAYEELAG
jgi:hypothetical protein